MKIQFIAIFLLAFDAFVLGIGCGANQPPLTITLGDGRYTPLGGVQKNDNPTASDFTDMQAAESGSLQQPAFVEFYADN